MKLNITIPKDTTAETTSVTLKDDIFKTEFNEALVHQVVTAYLAGSRAGTKAQKTRSEVSGGGIKPWRQKGTGRARAGTSRSPIWRSGGVTFAAKPRSYDQKVNKKMYRGAMRSILSELLRQNRLLVVNSFVVDKPKTKALLAVLKDLNIDSSKKTLIITEQVEGDLYLAARNLAKVEVRDGMGIDPVSLVDADTVVMAVPVIKQLEEKLG